MISAQRMGTDCYGLGLLVVCGRGPDEEQLMSSLRDGVTGQDVGVLNVQVVMVILYIWIVP